MTQKQAQQSGFLPSNATKRTLTFSTHLVSTTTSEKATPRRLSSVSRRLFFYSPTLSRLSFLSTLSCATTARLMKRWSQSEKSRHQTETWRAPTISEVCTWPTKEITSKQLTTCRMPRDSTPFRGRTRVTSNRSSHTTRFSKTSKRQS